MRISVFGLGYVGSVTSACLARDGHEVIGVDVNPDKVALIASGKAPIMEPGLSELLAQVSAQGRLRASTEVESAVASSDISLISVATPSHESGGVDLSHVFDVCRGIGQALREKTSDHVVVLRSTVPPGTLERCKRILAEASGRAEVSMAVNPEFLREGSALKDFDSAPFTIIGTEDAAAEAAVRKVYARVQAPMVIVKPTVAELIKIVSNVWHAAKVGFANEVGRIAKGLGVDGREVMAILMLDQKLSNSSAYLTPGFAYGGSCLPKDLRTLMRCARSKDISVPFLEALAPSNALHIDVAARKILQRGARRIVVLGLAFKKNTDDLRESPAVALVKRLIGEGCDLKIYDPSVNASRLVGVNLAYIRRVLPHFEGLLVSEAGPAVRQAELIVITYAAEEFHKALADAPRGTQVLDLAGLYSKPPEGLEYDAVAW